MMLDHKTATIEKGSLVLVTGANGFVASHIVKQLLEGGFKVRGTVRDINRTSWLIEDAFKDYASKGDFELVTIEDFTAEGAYNDAIKGVSGIVHVASIVTFASDPATVIPRTSAAATRILEAALTESSVKAFIYTSSVVAATTPQPGNSTHVDRNTWNDKVTELAWAPPPWPESHGSIVYAASKVAAEKAVWEFYDQKKPPFRVNSVIPAMIMGEPLNKSQRELASSWIDQLWAGNTTVLANFPATFQVDVKDVALLHIAAILDASVDNQRLPAWAANTNWNEILAILRKQYPQKHFIEDLPGQTKLSITADFHLPLSLLKKYGNMTGWTPLEQTLLDNTKDL